MSFYVIHGWNYCFLCNSRMDFPFLMQFTEGITVFYTIHGQNYHFLCYSPFFFYKIHRLNSQFLRNLQMEYPFFTRFIDRIPVFYVVHVQISCFLHDLRTEFVFYGFHGQNSIFYVALCLNFGILKNQPCI